MPRIVYDNDAEADFAVEVTFTKGASLTDHVAEILAIPEVAAKIAQVAKASYPCLYYRDGNDVMENSFARKLLGAFLKGGDVADVSEMIAEAYLDSDYYGQTRAEYFEGEEWCDTLKETAAKALRRSHRSADVEAVFDLALDEAIEIALQDADTSSPMDTIHRGTAVEIVYVPDLADAGGVEDMCTAYSGVCSSARAVMPDANFERVLTFLNISPDDYRKAVAADGGRDPATRPQPADFTNGEADYGYIQQDGIARGWRELQAPADLSRPALLSMKDTVEVMDNASYGGVPIVFFRTDLKAFMETWAKDGTHLEISPDERAGGHPQVGLHDFVNGSGHIVSIHGAVTLPKVAGNFFADGDVGYGVDSVYGFVKEKLRAAVSSVEAPHPSLELAGSPHP